MSDGHLGRDLRARFVHHVEARALLPHHLPAALAISAVMCTLMERLTDADAHELLEGLPKAVRPLFVRCEGHRGRGPVARLDRAEFLDRVARHLAVTPAHAELVSAAVFEAVSAELPPEIKDDIAQRLPHDLRELWLAPQLAELVTPAGDVLDEIERRVHRPEIATGREMFSAVMCALCDRISGGEARDVLLSLPQSLRPLVERCVEHRRERPAVFDRRELLGRIGEQLHVDLAGAEHIARAVFAAVKRVLPEKEIHDVTSQLPADLVALWQAH